MEAMENTVDKTLTWMAFQMLNYLVTIACVLR